MNVTCPNCATIYRVDPAKVPEAGVRARCAVCAAVFPVRREAAAVGRDAPATAAAASAPSSTAAPTTAVATPSAAPEAPPPAAVPVAPEVPGRPTQPPPAALAPPSPVPTMPAQPAGPRPPVSRPAGLPGGPTVPRPAVPPRPAGGQAGASVAVPAPPSSAGAGGARKPVNPFLSQDPGQKARRLARALISDMVVYHPAKRREGLRDGTLKTLFEEEIKKSWEEYTDQVGKDVAGSTTHFKDALNEILADGRQIF